nr:hypothetical protein [Tanacetum cinerariifolium]
MHSIGKTVNELHAMIKLHENTLPRRDAPALHAIRAGKGFRRSRKLKPGALSLYMGNGQHAAVEAIGSYDFCFPSGLVLVLHNCHYAAFITRGVISVFCFNKRAKLNLDSSLLWHCRLGHISKKRIEKLQHNGLLNAIDSKSFEKCVPCLSGKMVRKPYSHQVERAKDLLGLIHTDVCGPFRIVSRQGSSYFVTFTDDFSRYGYVYLLKHKHEVFQTFKVFKKEVENQLGKTIKSLPSDHGGEYMSQEFLDHLKEHGIISHRTPPYTLQHNGVSKRRNRTLLDMECKALIKRDTLTKPDKLEPRSIKCIFVRYPKETMGYSFYYPPENKVFVARNAEFFENSLIIQEAGRSLEDLEIIQEEDTHPSQNTSPHHDKDNQEIYEPQSDIIPIRRSIRTRLALDRMCLNIEADEYELADLNEPANYKAALSDPEFDKWLNAMNVEMQSMKDNEVQDLVDLTPNGKTVDSKWLFKKKTDMDGAVHTYKACLITKGFTQTPWIDYEETFSPIADIRVIRILIAIAAFYDYETWQMDVKTAFVNEYLSKENPGELHWTAVKNILKYLRNTKDIFLAFGGDIKRELRVSCYTDVGYLTDADDLKSQTAYVLVLNGSAVDWKSTKQSIFTTSSTEVEYIVASNASKEAVWVRKFIVRLGVVPTIKEPKKMYCDNTRAITIANESRITKDARHYHTKVHYLREVIEYGDVKLEKVHT